MPLGFQDADDAELILWGDTGEYISFFQVLAQLFIRERGKFRRIHGDASEPYHACHGTSGEL